MDAKLKRSREHVIEAVKSLKFALEEIEQHKDARQALLELKDVRYCVNKAISELD